MISTAPPGGGGFASAPAFSNATPTLTRAILNSSQTKNYEIRQQGCCPCKKDPVSTSSCLGLHKTPSHPRPHQKFVNRVGGGGGRSLLAALQPPYLLPESMTRKQPSTCLGIDLSGHCTPQTPSQTLQHVPRSPRGWLAGCPTPLDAVLEEPVQQRAQSRKMIWHCPARLTAYKFAGRSLCTANAAPLANKNVFITKQPIFCFPTSIIPFKYYSVLATTFFTSYLSPLPPFPAEILSSAMGGIRGAAAD